jgi:dUTP pyrophosphatase
MSRLPILKSTSRALLSPSLPGDVGYNLPALEPTTVPPGAYVEVGTGIKVEIPEGYWGLILPRSSANRTRKLLVLTGVIDQGFRGELMAWVHNLRHHSWWTRLMCWLTRNPDRYSVQVQSGQSLAQLVLLPACVFPIDYVDSLSESHRGENGYGHTGNGISHVPANGRVRVQ